MTSPSTPAPGRAPRTPSLISVLRPSTWSPSSSLTTPRTSSSSWTRGTDLIVTVGFLLGVDTAKFAKANPEQKFAIVDYAYPDCWPGANVGMDCGSDQDLANVLGLTFQTDQAAFLAGYLAAGMTTTGKVATFGGLQIPTVTIFMKGFEAGVKYYKPEGHRRRSPGLGHRHRRRHLHQQLRIHR